MRLDKFTVKAQEAVQAAQSLTDQLNHQAIEPEHLLSVLLDQREGVVGPILSKLGARPESVQRDLKTALGKLPTVRGASGQYVSERTRQALERAQAEAQRLKDEYVSTEHLLLASAKEKGSISGWSSRSLLTSRAGFWASHPRATARSRICRRTSRMMFARRLESFAPWMPGCSFTALIIRSISSSVMADTRSRTTRSGRTKCQRQSKCPQAR